MPTPEELREKLWKALKSDMTVMIGVMGPKDNHKRPMAAQLRDGDDRTIWFFGDGTTELASALTAGPASAEACFAAKGHDLFACLHGALAIDTDRAVIDELWNSHIAAWYPGGREDPKLVLFRFEPVEAEIWGSETGLLASVKALFGADPSAEHEREQHATVTLT
ncbi:MAG: general stress protein [Rhodovulum sulfidophilum]|uniref:General stress protein n=1 Tax=Rhodovulum sulfidophilum TaxID=35806 RepID=A0A2W5N9U4_RHOSU|nr:MAG: general stress protein [Rhodovulum sulfidophilum]